VLLSHLNIAHLPRRVDLGGVDNRHNPRRPKQERLDDRPSHVVVGLHTAGHGAVAHRRHAIGLLALGLRLPIRRRLRRQGVRCRGLTGLAIELMRLAVRLLAIGLLRALAVWGGHTSS
jgi:hypothetical protein